MHVRQLEKMKFVKRLWVIIITTMLIFSQVVEAQLAPREKHLPAIDVRQENMPAGLIADAFVTSQQREAEKHIRRVYPNLNLKWNPLTGTPRSLYTLDGFLTADSKQEPIIIARNFLEANRNLFRLTTSDLETLVVVRKSQSQGSKGIRKRIIQNMTHFTFDQRWQGRQVYPAGLVGSIADKGQLISIAGEVVPNLATAVNETEPGISPIQALEKAAISLGASFNASQHPLVKDPEGSERRQTFAAGTDFDADVPVRLIYFVVAKDKVNLVWEVTAGKARDPYTYLILVDAMTGDILYRVTITDFDTPRWLVYSQALQTPTSHPKDHMRPFDSPAPFSPGPDTPDGTQGANTAASLIQTNGGATFSPDGWIPDGVDTTSGNNVIAFVDKNSNYTADAGEQPTAAMEDVDGVATRTFNFPADFTSAPDTTENENAAVTNAFFLANWYHDRLFELGFDEAAGNFQETNFTTDGVGGDPVKVRLHVGYDNSTFSTPAADGTCCPTLNAYTFTGPDPDRDAAFDQEILVHELTHGLTIRIIGGPNVKGLSGWITQSGALGDGYCDWYAITLLSEDGDALAGNHAIGGWAVYDLLGNDFKDNYYYGIRRYPYSTDMENSPLTLADIDPALFDDDGVAMSPLFPDPLSEDPDEVHNAGEIWALALWEVRANLVTDHGWATGNELILQLVTDSLFLLPQNPTFIEARDAVLLADLARTGGTNLCRIWEGFAKRGFGVGASTPADGSANGVVEDFTPQTSHDCRPLMDLVLVLDFSDSMNSPEACEDPPQDIKIQVLKQAVPAFLNAWEPFAVSGDRIGIMYFDDDADPRSSPLMEDLLINKNTILTDVDGRATGIYTALGPGVLSAADSFDVAVRKRHMIILSDGIQNVNPLIVSVGDSDGDTIEEHHVVNSTDAWGGDSATVPEQPNKLLQDFEIPMHTLSIGSGPGTTYDELLAAVAEETSGLHQHTCVPQEELENFLTNSLVEALQGDTLELIGYETGSLASNSDPQEHLFAINGSTYRAVFMLSWSGGSGSPSDMELRLISPDGIDIPIAPFLSSGNSFHRITLDFPFFSSEPQHEGTPVAFVGDWRLIVERKIGDGGLILYRAYALVDDAALGYRFDILNTVISAGEHIPLRVKVTEGSHPLKPDVIEVNVHRPRGGLGNLINSAKITDADRQRIAAELGYQELQESSLMQTYEVVFRDPSNSALLVPYSENIELFDDGLDVHGDAQANDGIYSALYKNTKIPGEYQFNFMVEGQSEFNGAYVREKTASATVAVRKPTKTEFEFEIIEKIGKGGTFSLIITPKDRFGNYLGPGYAQRMQISIPNATAQSSLHDRLDGSYIQRFQTDDFGNVSQGDATIFDTKVEIPRLAGAVGLSLHGGLAVPFGSYKNTHEKGLTVNLDFLKFININLAWDIRLGYSRFNGKGSQADLNVWTLSGNIKYYLNPGNPYKAFVNGGLGVYSLDPGDIEGGYNIGFGVYRNLTPHLSFEATVNYCSIFTTPPDLKYGLFQLGLIYLF